MKFAVDHEENRSGETFVYRGYDCRISYNGIRPSFSINDKKAEDVLSDFSVERDVGKSGWQYLLMKKIDELEGIDVDSDDYISPARRISIRRFSRKYIEDFMTQLFDDYALMVSFLEDMNYNMAEIQQLVRTEQEDMEFTDFSKFIGYSYYAAFEHIHNDYMIDFLDMK